MKPHIFMPYSDGNQGCTLCGWNLDTEFWHPKELQAGVPPRCPAHHVFMDDPNVTAQCVLTLGHTDRDHQSCEGRRWITFSITPDKVFDPVNRPRHYVADNGMEVWDVIEAFKLDFLLGNVVKYILRHECKTDALEDLKKARACLDRKILTMEKSP